MIYLDNAATTRPSRLAIETFNEVSEKIWGNPSSTMYEFGMDAKRLLDEAREIVAGCIGARPEQIIFTSGATEGANMIINSFINHYPDAAFVANRLEHPCVYNSLKKHDCVVYAGTREDGRVDIKDVCRLADLFPNDNVLIVMMHVNNETGIINDIAGVGNYVEENDNVRFFSDLTQTFAHGGVINMGATHIDYACASAHKFGGFKGTGFVYVRDSNLHPLMWGGHQEFGMRPGTENVASIYAMAKQLKHIHDNSRITWLKEYDLRSQLRLALPDGARVNDAGGQCVPGIMSITIPGCDAQTLISYLALDGYCLSAGAACSSGTGKPSRVLVKMGFTPEDAACTIRVSFNIDNTMDEIKRFGEDLQNAIRTVQTLH